MKEKRVLTVPSLAAIERLQKKRTLERSLFSYLKWLFEIRKEPFYENWHHHTICDALEKVTRREIKNLILTVPPRYTKTEIVIKAFCSWCMALNDKSLFIQLSYSDELALDNSSEVRDIIQSAEYQYFWPIELKKDTDAKKKWYTEAGGGMYSVATGGQVTGFGAGSMNKNEFAGAILIDDPIKPEDANSDTLRAKINKRFNQTIKSRKNSDDTPVIIIMQRLHEEDLVGFLKDGGSELDFTVINLPAINEDGPSEYDPREVGEALWPDKHPIETLLAMKKADPEVFAAQYQQDPSPLDGSILKDEHIRFYEDIPLDFICRVHSWDFTFKEKSKTKNKKTDFVVGYEWGLTSSKHIYLLPWENRDRMGFLDSLEALLKFQEERPGIEALLIEDKANGPAIIDTLTENGVQRIVEVEPTGTKAERFSATIPLWKNGIIWLPHPSIAPWITDYITELKKFPKAKNDDRVDATSQAIEYLEKKSKVNEMPMPTPGQKKSFRKSFEDKFKKNSNYKSKIRF